VVTMVKTSETRSKKRGGRIREFLRGRDKGYVALSFAAALPILLLVIGIIVQYALLVHAQLTVERAVQAGARSAMTALPVDPAIGDAGGPEYVARSIMMTLESLSPAGTEVSTNSETVAAALTALGMTLPDRYTQRFTYAENATQISIQPIDGNGVPIQVTDFSKVAAPRVRLTVQYDYQVKVPLLAVALGRVDVIDGVSGRFRTLTATLDVQLSHGREAPTDGVGVP
jgi:hypothetical protein